MRLREMEPGTVIHCRTQEQALYLVENYGIPKSFVEYWRVYKDSTCYFYNIRVSDGWCWGSVDDAVRDCYKIIEFEDFEDVAIDKRPVLENYITCELMTGEVLDFGGMCNTSELNGPKGDLVIFRYDNGKTFLNLVAIPMSNIKWIKYVNSRETINKVMEGFKEKVEE